MNGRQTVSTKSTQLHNYTKGLKEKYQRRNIF